MGPKVKKKLWHPDRAFEELTHKQNQFVRSYVTKKSPGYLNQRRAVLEAYNTTSVMSADRMANVLMKNPKIQKTLRSMLENAPHIRENLMRGLDHRIANCDEGNKTWTDAAKLYTQITGDLAPEKQAVLTGTVDLGERYKAIAKLVKGESDAVQEQSTDEEVPSYVRGGEDEPAGLRRVSEEHTEELARESSEEEEEGYPTETTEESGPL